MAEGFIEKTKDFFGFGAVESYDDAAYDRDEFNDYRADDDRRTGGETATGRHSHSRYAADNPVDRRSTAVPPVEDRRPSSYSRPAVEREPELVVVSVDSYRDAGKVTPEARRGDIVAFNLGNLDKADGNRFLAFVMGVASALDARVEKLDGVRNFVLLPEGTRLTMDIRDALSARLSGRLSGER
ncbi:MULTISPECIES: cell division protein SepF [Corynebacterium]|jgi:cell division inhibitor SepF|uniref:Cell division protein SepF n=2 Tax=Corynebacterium provencense TaxID=1737425 RepID=A0A2Z3YWJ8_9CORY|nr:MULTISPECIES: cell division protein SepF [Corynebacterium]AWT26427.1 Cell division protein SepF [Corynebacterium provencense]